MRPIAAYIGGKRHLAERLVGRIEAVPHRAYVEPFFGMGGVFLRRRRAPAAEVINDVSQDVSTFLRVVQRHHGFLQDLLRWHVTSRAEFDRLMATDPSVLTDLERAARFLYLQRLAFGGKVAGRSFGVSPGLPGRFDMRRIGPALDELHERLGGVIVENLSYPDVFERYDSPETLFYLDPPYHGSETDYGRGVFGEADFARLARILAGLAGSFILSINDTPHVRATFAAFALEEVSVPYTIGSQGAVEGRELIVSPHGQARRPPELFDRA